MNKADLVLLMLLLAVLVLLTINILIIFSSNAECVKNPLTYGVKKWGDANNDELFCRCYFLKGGELFVTKDNLTIEYGRG